jgi:urea transporter
MILYFVVVLGCVLAISVIAELVDVIRQRKYSEYVTLSDRRAKLQKVLKEEE